MYNIIKLNLLSIKFIYNLFFILACLNFFKSLPINFYLSLFYLFLLNFKTIFYIQMVKKLIKLFYFNT